METSLIDDLLRTLYPANLYNVSGNRMDTTGSPGGFHQGRPSGSGEVEQPNKKTPKKNVDTVTKRKSGNDDALQKQMQKHKSQYIRHLNAFKVSKAKEKINKKKETIKNLKNIIEKDIKDVKTMVDKVYRPANIKQSTEATEKVLTDKMFDMLMQIDALKEEELKEKLEYEEKMQQLKEIETKEKNRIEKSIEAMTKKVQAKKQELSSKNIQAMQRYEATRTSEFDKEVQFMFTSAFP